MRYIAFTIILLLIVLPLASPHGGVAGTIEPNFKEHLKHLASNQVAQALVMMSDRVDVKAIERSFGNNPTLRERHRAVVSALIEKAKSTQEGLILFLESQRRLDSVSSYRPYWITNMIAVTATREVIEEIAARADVEKVYEDFEVIPYEPVTMDRSGPGSMGTEPNLAQIHADSLWMWGITGYGTLVCNIDTGVDGNHPALASRWRGLDPGVNWWEAWYDPVTDSLFPFDDGFHGTHTMGIMCGYDEDNDHHIGVAYDAKWIAASVIDRVGGPGRFSVYASAFEWAADPDSNPATIEDVPDVISNSWGIGWDLPACDETFWEVIDNCEAAGSIVLFAAGNEGPWPQSLRNPADRNTTPLNVLAVGATEGDSMIAYFSSRGPSTCDDESKKPEICAPGVSIVSSVPGGNYNAYNGTSMACPHVAGAAALLREVDPDAPPELVKEALYLSAQEVKYDSIPGEDNNYGMGLLDCAAAYHYLTELTTFTDISSSCGIETGGVGRGCAWGDFDGDGDDDLYVTNNGEDRLFRNDPWRFTEVSTEMGITGAWNSYAPRWVDYDRDRDLDLFVAVTAGPNRLYRNDGDRFTDVSDFVGDISSEWGNSRDAVWFDYNMDGWPDLYIVNAFTDNKLYRNDNGTFTDVTAETGLTGAGGEGIGVADYDNDGDPDIYICYAGIGHPNSLYRNDLTNFTDVTEVAGVGADSAGSYGCAWGDYDNDGDLDLYVCNGNGKNLLLRNNGGVFENVSRLSGTDNPGSSKSAVWMDYDNDGDLDLYLTNWSGSSLYLNTGEGIFLEVSQTRGVMTETGIGVSTSDFDTDGDLDIYVTRGGSGLDDRLYQNEGTRNHWLSVALQGDLSDRYGIGARVVVTVDGVSMLREVAGGNGLYSQSSYALNFGLGSETIVDQIEVFWPSGMRSSVSGATADQRIVINEIPRNRRPRNH